MKKVIKQKSTTAFFRLCDKSNYLVSFFIDFFTYIKLSKYSLAKYYKRKKKNIIMNNIKLFLKMISKGWLSKEKNMIFEKIKMIHIKRIVDTRKIRHM